MRRGFIWTMELILGLITLWGIWGMVAMEPNQPTSLMPETLCTDLAVLYTYGTDISTLTQLYYDEWNIELSEEELDTQPGNQIVCHATRVENGVIHTLFIRIPQQ